MNRAIIFSVLFASTLVANATDRGAIDAINANGASGWACSPETPNHQGPVHAYRDDGIFLGEIWANVPREQAVANLCGGNGAHGFSGGFSYPSSAIDGQIHNVHLYFFRSDNSHFELPGSPRQVLFGEPPFVLQTVSGCHMLNNPGPGNWILKTRNNECRPSPNQRALTYTWAYFPNVPSGYQMEVCDAAIPSGWSLVGTSNASPNCLQVNFNAEFLPSTSYTIRKN